jgi:hypothetical protein
MTEVETSMAWTAVRSFRINVPEEALVDLCWRTCEAKPGVSGARIYWENKCSYFNAKNHSVPTAVSVFPGEQYQAPGVGPSGSITSSSITTGSTRAATSRPGNSRSSSPRSSGRRSDRCAHRGQ